MANSFVYDSPEGVRAWVSIGERHYHRDVQFWNVIRRYFKPGRIHEVGAGCGHIAQILQGFGYDVTASDFARHFVDYMQSIGLRAERYDARELDKVIDGKYDTIIAQGLTPLCVRDKAENVRTLRALHNSLSPGGRLISIFAIKRDDFNKTHYFQPDEQIKITLETGLFRLVKVIPHQVTPPRFHNAWTTKFLTPLDFYLAKIICIRKVMVWERT